MADLAGGLRELGAQLLTPELVLFPVRHHSPACALQLKRLFVSRAFSSVLLEGPRSFDSLLPMLASPDARMPLAAYAYAVRRAEGERPEHRQAAYYPFCDYSPELVALREAAARGLPTRFIDLDFVEQCLLEPEGPDALDRSLLDESHFARSDYLRALAAQLGCRDVEELWEHLFEVDSPGGTPEQHVERIAAYCELARRDSTEAELRADGTLAREAEMAFHINAALEARAPGDGAVLAVVGGFHAVALPALLARKPARPRISRASVSDEGSALIRYSFDRLDRLNGYGAGMTSPAWHQLLWEGMQKQEALGRVDTTALRHQATQGLLQDIAEELRARANVPLPMPALTAASEQALLLARLRGRRGPVREDLMDAITSCFIKGDADADGAVVRAAAQRLLGGLTLGHLPPGGKLPPLVRDFHARARRQRLKIEDVEPRRANLEIYRRADHRLTSRLLHGLVLLGIPFATRTAGPDFVRGLRLDRLQEQWDYCMSPATEAALVEASVHGATVPEAVASRFVQRIAQAESGARDARAAAALLVEAFVLGLHDHVARIGALLRAAVAADAAFDSVVAACSSLALLWESREPLEAREHVELPGLLGAAYERCIYLLRDLQVAKGSEPATVVALGTLRELLTGGLAELFDASLYWDGLERLQGTHPLPRMRGAALGLRYSAGRLAEGALQEAVAGHLRGQAEPGAAVAFLDGLLQTAREAAWQEPELLEALDLLLCDWDENDFIANLPELRLAFAVMTPKETDRIGEAVAQLHGVEALGPLVNRDIDAATVQRHLLCSEELRRLLAEDGLADWSGA